MIPFRQVISRTIPTIRSTTRANIAPVQRRTFSGSPIFRSNNTQPSSTLEKMNPGDKGQVRFRWKYTNSEGKEVEQVVHAHGHDRFQRHTKPEQFQKTQGDKDQPVNE
jgi:hypothetical protein